VALAGRPRARDRGAARADRLAFLASNTLKIPDGGWFPLLIGGIVFTLLTTWKRGRKVLFDRLSEDALPLKEFIQSIELAPPVRVEGTAVFLTSTPDRVPHALLHNLKHNKVLHERVVFLTVVTREIPFVASDERIEIETLGCDFYRMICYYGFKEEPDVPELLEDAGKTGFPFEMMETSFFVSRETLIPSVRPGMARWRERPVLVDVEERGQGVRLLPRPDQPRRRARDAGRALEATTPARSRRRRSNVRSVTRPSRTRRASASAPCSRSGGSARRTRRTRRRAPAASPDRFPSASAPR
jgi:hypothetical protein